MQTKRTTCRRWLLLHAPVTDGVARYGTLQLRVSTAALRERTRSYLFLAGGVTAAIASLALLLAMFLQRSIARPIVELTRVAKAVAPLTSLKLSLKSLQSARDGAVFDQQQRRFVNLATKQSDRLERLVSELLSVTRLQRAKVVLNLEDADLVEVIHEVAERFAPELARSGNRLDVEVTGPIVGRWDRSRLDQVVTNLLSNACKFGEGKPIELETTVEGDRVRLVVRDQGRGIPADEIHRIFEPYERAVPAASFGGLGLGLFIVRSLVEAHGGTVRAESVLGQGATFTVELPLAGPPD